MQCEIYSASQTIMANIPSENPIMAVTALLLFVFAAISTADVLQNPDFESPPTNITSNTSSPLLLLNGINKIPGWSFSGTVWYVTSGPNISLPQDSHGILLGQDGKINQTFRASNNYNDYVLTFSLAPGSKGCSNTSIGVNVSTQGRSKVFSLGRKYGLHMWESHAFYFASWDDESGIINLEIESIMPKTNVSAICGPAVDTFFITEIGSPIWYGENLVANNGFETGPAFFKNSSEGILLVNEPDQLQSPLQQWTIMGTVKYIDAKHYAVPEGKAAIEIVSSDPSGILITMTLSKGSTYTLEFTMGDANDSCAGELTLWAQVGRISQNYSIRSNGTGLAQNHSFTFKAESSLTPISFVSFNQSQRNDGVLCGPVLDNVILRSSFGVTQHLSVKALYVFIFIVTILL